MQQVLLSSWYEVYEAGEVLRLWAQVENTEYEIQTKTDFQIQRKKSKTQFVK